MPGSIPAALRARVRAEARNRFALLFWQNIPQQKLPCKQSKMPYVMLASRIRPSSFILRPFPFAHPK